jgi:hypothetical protein
MVRFRPVKCLALAWTLSAVAAAAISQVRELDSDRRIVQVRQLLRSLGQLQGEDCAKRSKALDSAIIKLMDQVNAAAFDGCTSRCTIDYKSFSAYSSYSSACSAAKGALAAYKITHSCPGVSLVLVSVPICLVSKKTNKNCAPKLFEDFLEPAIGDAFTELFIGVDGCTTTVTNTGYTDFSGPKPVKKPVKRPVRRRAFA